MSTVTSAVAVALSAILAPVKTALEAGVADPNSLIKNLEGLAINSVINVPALKNDALALGCQEALALMADLQAKLDGATSAAAPVNPISIPVTVTASSAMFNGTTGAS